MPIATGFANDCEKVWLEQFIGGFGKNFREKCGTEITIDLESMCKNKDGSDAKDLTIEEAIADDGKGAWGLVDSISINSSGL